MSCWSVKVSGEVTVFFQWCSDVESVKKLMYMCKTNNFNWGQICFCFFLFNIVLDDYDILLSYIWWWRPLNRRLLYVKQQMFHDTWSYHIVIVLYMSVGSHTTQAKSINWWGYFVLVYLSVFWIEPNRIIDIHLSHIRPLCRHSVNTCKALQFWCHYYIKYAQRHIYSKPKIWQTTESSSVVTYFLSGCRA